MIERTPFEGTCPKTQSIEAVQALIEFVNGAPCEVLPAIFKLANGWQLTKSSKGDCYYVTSTKECSCPGFVYRRSCRHVKALRNQEEATGVLLLDAYASNTTEEEIDYWKKKEQEEKLSPSQVFARDIVAAMEA